jgi:hypothetical protein
MEALSNEEEETFGEVIEHANTYCSGTGGY